MINLQPICPVHNHPYKLDAWEDDIPNMAFFIYFSDPQGCRFRSRQAYAELGGPAMSAIRGNYPNIKTARLRAKGN